MCFAIQPSFISQISVRHIWDNSRELLAVPILPRAYNPISTLPMRFLDQDKDPKNKKSKKTGKDITKKQDNSAFYNVLTPNCKVQCDGCEKDISKYVKVSTGDLDYCVGCFSNLEQYPESYTIINKLNFPVLEGDWTAEEELLLMQALERHGFGNWNEISEQIGTQKTASDIQKHYQEVFMCSPGFVPTDREILSKRDERSMKLNISKSGRIQIKRGRKSKDADQPVVSPTNQAQRGSLSSVPNQQSLLNTGNVGDVVGYMHKRGDFEVEYDNEAELLLAEMEFNDDDTEEEKEMKFKILEIYNFRLSERIKRKDFVISRQLLNVKLQNQLEKNRGKEERQIHNMLKPFARFNAPEDHEKLVDGVLKEKEIRQRIEELRHYRKMGLKTLAEVEQHLQEKRRKQELKKKTQKTGEGSYLFDNKIGKTAGSGSRRTRGTDVQGTNQEKHNSGLTSDQNKLCESLSIPTAQYIVIKETLVRECIKHGFIKKDGLDNIFRVDKEKIGGVFDFLVQNGVVMTK